MTMRAMRWNRGFGCDVGGGNILTKITPRQAEIVRLFGNGKSYLQIARELNISRHTVENHIRHARRRANCETTIQLAIKVMAETMRDQNENNA